MKVSKVADKIVAECVKNFYQTGNQFSCSETVIGSHPGFEPNLVYAALRMLEHDGLVSVEYADDEPQNFAVNVDAIMSSDADTWFKKGYDFMKEIRSWI